MSYVRWTIESELPEPLTREELLFYFQEMAKGNMKAREKIINHNLRLVSHEILKNFGSTKADKNELFSVGSIGLIKSIDRFDISKNTEFSTYAVTMINGEIMRFLRDQHKIPNVMSIETSIFSNKDGDELQIADMLRDDSDFVLDYEQKEIYRIIDVIVENLPPRDREVTKHYFGFYDNIPKGQAEIANIIGISQAQVSRVLTKIINQIKLELYNQGILEYRDLTIKERYKEQEKTKSPKKPKTIYTLFKYYSKSQVNDMLSRMTEEERELVTIRYGEDLEHPVATEKWNDENRKKFNTLYRKMRYLLANPEKVSNPFKKGFGQARRTFNSTKAVSNSYSKKEEIKEPNKKGNKRKMAKQLQSIYEYFKNYTKEQVDEMLTKLTEEEKKLITLRYGKDLDNPSTSQEWTMEYQNKFYGSLIPKMKRLLANPTGERKPRKPRQLEQVEGDLITKPSEPQETPVEQTPKSPDNGEMSKEDYTKIFELLRTPTFSQMMSVLSVKESVIISLKLGYIDGKYFSTESIAQFLGIEETEVIETTKKVLLVYKDHINNFLDSAISVATGQVGQGRVLSMKNQQNTREA